MLGKVPSLNVSVAAAVVLFEIVRQRRARAESSHTKSGGTKSASK
jgi:tRNA(Leu) C34 or U34 (ribose-2'-O)-methylase TrmL